MLPAALLAVDLGTPRMQSLAREHGAEKQELEEVRKSALRALLAESQTQAQNLLAEKKRSGNIAGMAAARTAINILTKISEELDKTGSFALPETVRREIRELFDDIKAKKARIDDNFQGDADALDFRYADRLRAVASEQGELPSEDESLELVKKLVSGQVSTLPGPVGEAPDGETPADKPDEGPTVLDTHGQGDEWVTVMRWEAEAYGIQVIDFQVINCSKPRTERTTDPLGQALETTITPVRVLVPGKAPAYAFRLVSVPGKAPAQVVRWPNGSNAWKITLRTRPQGAPSLHAVDLQVSYPGASEMRMVGKDPGGGAAGVGTGAAFGDGKDSGVKVQLTTQPPGARVYIDDQLCRDGETPLETPCSVSATPGRHRIVMRLPGYRDAEFPGVEFREGKSLSWTFRRERRADETTVRVSATRTWRPSGVKINAGDNIAIVASGTWSCGNRREQVDANGYPNIHKFAHYYSAPKQFPRQTTAGNYGALLMRIGPSGGPVAAVGTSFKARMRVSGELYFDINEGPGQLYRRDNAGTLEVRILKQLP